MSSITPSPNTPPKTKELSSELRMVLAFALMGLILFGTQWLFKRLGYAATPPVQTE